MNAKVGVSFMNAKVGVHLEESAAAGERERRRWDGRLVR